jgi:hypothetical protein
VIYIINSYDSQKIGHFWTWDSLIRKAYAEESLRFTYLNPDAIKAENNDAKMLSSNNTYIAINNDDEFVSNSINYIKADILMKNIRKAVVMLPFLPQFSRLEISEISNLSETTGKEVSIVGITVHTKEATFWQKSELRLVFQDIFAANQNCKILWAGEKVPEELSSLHFIRELPDYMECDQNSEKNNDSLCFFGSLNAYRGITEILFIALFNPKLNIVIQGHGFAPNLIWRPIKFEFAKFGSWKENPIFAIPINIVSLILSLLRFLPNIKFIPKAFPEEADLERAITESGALFYCAKLPYGSGIVNKALYAKKPIIWHGYRGRAFEFLESKFNQGRIEYFDIFIPNRVYKKFQSIKLLQSSEAVTWDEFSKEIGVVSKYI